MLVIPLYSAPSKAETRCVLTWYGTWLASGRIQHIYNSIDSDSLTFPLQVKTSQIDLTSNYLSTAELAHLESPSTFLYCPQHGALNTNSTLRWSVNLMI